MFNASLSKDHGKVLRLSVLYFLSRTFVFLLDGIHALE